MLRLSAAVSIPPGRGRIRNLPAGRQVHNPQFGHDRRVYDSFGIPYFRTKAAFSATWSL